MWAEIKRYMPKFRSAVLTGLDAAGRPYSLRCRPKLDVAETTLRLELPDGIPIEPSAACLLFHSHDERLWSLLSFVLRGRLERDGQDWEFQPGQFIPGAGIGGLLSYVRFLRDGRRMARRYLARRGLARPKVPWEEWQGVFDRARSESKR